MTAPSTASPFPPTGFGRFWFGEAVSGFGNYVSVIALQVVVVLTLGGTATQVGWLNSTRWLPYLIIGLVVGALVDRRRRRSLMVVTDLTRALLLMAIPLAYVTDALSLPLLLAIVAVFGTASLVNDAASMSFLPRLVPGEHLQRAHARIDGADAVAQTSGPALAGLLVSLVGASFAVLVNAGTYLVSAFMVATLDIKEPPPAAADSPNLRREIREGFKGVYGRSGLATLAISTHTWFIANTTVSIVIAPFALLELNLNAFQFGVVTGVAGVGALAGAALTSMAGRRVSTGGAIMVARGVSTCGVLVMALSGIGTSGWAAAGVLGAGVALHGFGMGLSNSHEMSYQQRLTPDGLQARVNTTMRSANRAVIVVVAPVAGLLADQFGMRPAILCAAAVFAVAVAILAAAAPLRLGVDAPAGTGP